MLKLHIALTNRWAELQDWMNDREEGATAVEYGMLVALIAAVIVVVVKALGTKVNTAFTTINSNLP